MDKKKYETDPFYREEYDRALERAKQIIKKKELKLDKIRGSLFGGAIGDALGYPVEFLDEAAIFN